MRENLSVDLKQARAHCLCSLPRASNIQQAYYRGADGIILVYDVTSQESFDHVQDWIVEVNRYASEGTSKLLIGNKCDRSDRVVSTEAGEAYANNLDIPFLETSAKTSTNVEAAFLAMASELIKAREAGMGAAQAPGAGNVNMAGERKSDSGCC